MCLGTGVIVMEASVLNLAIPTIRGDLHATADAGLWIVDAYTLTFAGFLLTAGRVGDRLGTRRSYLLGLSVFAAASLAGALAPSASVLIAARAVQGLGAALLAPAPLALITRTYTDQEARSRAVGVWVSVAAAGFLIAPPISGALIDLFGWRSIFYLNLPLAAMAAALTLAAVDPVTGRPARLDLPGQVFAIAGLTVLTWAVISSSEHGWARAETLVGLAAGLILCAAFVVAELRRGETGHDVLLPASLLRSRRVIAGLLAGAVYNFVLYGMLIVVSYSFQTHRHYSALLAGFALTPLAVAATLTSSLVSSRAVRRYGPRDNVIGGMLLGAVGLGVIAAVIRSAPYPVLVIGFVIFAVGQNLVAPSQTLLVVTGAPPDHANAASSALNTARQTGGVVGVALLGSLQVTGSGDGATIALLAAAAACVTAAVAARLLVAGRAAA